MKYVSKIFQPIITVPRNAKIKNTEITCKSQKLLLECGLIRPTSSGFLSLLPLAKRSLDKLENIVKECLEAIGAQRISLPALTSTKLWQASGRLADIGPELMKVEDRHGKQYLLSPTHEEAIADLFADVGPLSYKQLPLLLYQISNKYRDEHRPKHGLLRAREFVMCDAYAAHATEACARAVYGDVTDAYQRLFARLHLHPHRVEAPAGEMGGSLSHEWQLPAAAGEDRVRVCAACGAGEGGGEGAGEGGGEGKGQCAACGGALVEHSSIEVGHTFLLGTKYSQPLNANIAPSNQPIYMSCYGIGITRLLAASLEALSSEKALRWPTAIAPYKAIIIGPKEGSKEWQAHGPEKIEELYRRITEVEGYKDDVLVDDRSHMTVGKRLLMAENYSYAVFKQSKCQVWRRNGKKLHLDLIQYISRMGYPAIIVCGRACVTSQYEFHQPMREPALLHLQDLHTLLT